MASIKYTTDGKKVAVIGKLNNAETIVQEIYVGKDGSEIPAGEQFVVKSLLDEPRETWQSKRVREIEAHMKRLDAEREKRRVEMRNAEAFAKAKIEALRRIGRKAADESLQTLAAFVGGEITHLVRGKEYGSLTIAAFDESLADAWDGRVEGVKLLSLFGKSDGSLVWHLHQYSDHSGSRYEIIPAKSYADAVAIVQRVHDERIQEWRDGKRKSPPSPVWDNMPAGIVSPDDVIEWHRAKRAEAKAARLAKLRDEIAKLESEGE